ncbi:MAG: hypothetical protein MJ078_03985 [Clostridia bacterium]|nr:hypothetical protein [Clostridia bacterium]
MLIAKLYRRISSIFSACIILACVCVILASVLDLSVWLFAAAGFAFCMAVFLFISVGFAKKMQQYIDLMYREFDPYPFGELVKTAWNKKNAVTVLNYSVFLYEIGQTEESLKAISYFDTKYVKDPFYYVIYNNNLGTYQKKDPEKRNAAVFALREATTHLKNPAQQQRAQDLLTSMLLSGAIEDGNLQEAEKWFATERPTLSTPYAKLGEQLAEARIALLKGNKEAAEPLLREIAGKAPLMRTGKEAAELLASLS